MSQTTPGAEVMRIRALRPPAGLSLSRWAVAAADVPTATALPCFSAVIEDLIAREQPMGLVGRHSERGVRVG